MKRRYFLCDVSLKDYAGHCFGYMSPIRSELMSRGAEVFLVGNKTQDYKFHVETNTIPAFTYWCDQRNVGQSQNLTEDQNNDFIRSAHEQALINDLKFLHARFGFTNEDLIVMNTLRHWALRGIPMFIEQIGIHSAPKFSIISLFSSEPDLGIKTIARKHYKDAFEYISHSEACPLIKLLTDSKSLLEEYKSFSDLSIYLAPFPQYYGEVDNIKHDNKISVSYFGEARKHKGFHMLPFLAKYLESKKIKNDITIKIQSYISDYNQNFYLGSIRSLKSRTNVCLIPEILSDSQYNDFLVNSDIFLLPYSLSNYHRQTSAVYAAACSLGKPVVVTRGTWMARITEQSGAGEAVNPDDYLDFAKAVENVCNNISTYQKNAIAYASKWRAFNNANSFISLVS